MSILKYIHISFPSILLLNREVYGVSLENIKKLLLGIKLMIISTNSLVILKLRDKLTDFHDVLCYLASLSKVKSTLRSMLHVFFVVV